MEEEKIAEEQMQEQVETSEPEKEIKEENNNIQKNPRSIARARTFRGLSLLELCSLIHFFSGKFIHLVDNIVQILIVEVWCHRQRQNCF